VLEQATPFPELGTADALLAIAMHQISRRAAGETVGLIGATGGIAKLQGLAHGGKRFLKPKATQVISLPTPARGIGPDEGVGEITAMENG
jgi:hypothetical protein